MNKCMCVCVCVSFYKLRLHEPLSRDVYRFLSQKAANAMLKLYVVKMRDDELSVIGRFNTQYSMPNGQMVSKYLFIVLFDFDRWKRRFRPILMDEMAKSLYLKNEFLPLMR